MKETIYEMMAIAILAILIGSIMIFESGKNNDLIGLWIGVMALFMPNVLWYILSNELMGDKTG